MRQTGLDDARTVTRRAGGLAEPVFPDRDLRSEGWCTLAPAEYAASLEAGVAAGFVLAGARRQKGWGDPLRGAIAPMGSTLARVEELEF